MTKTIFITGGSTGIGQASVEKFHAMGWNVGFMDINVEAGQKLADTYDNVLFFEGDTRNKSDITNAVSQTVAHFGGLDSIFANAGIHRSNSLLDITDEELDFMLDVNVKGCVNTLRIAVPYLLERGGSVIINSSDQFHIGKANSFGYGLTKGATGQIARSLAIDLGPKNIRVNAICAATIVTPLSERIFAAAKEGGPTWESEAENYPLKRVGKASEVAEFVYFLASDGANFMTGGVYLIDGGLVAQ